MGARQEPKTYGPVPRTLPYPQEPCPQDPLFLFSGASALSLGGPVLAPQAITLVLGTITPSPGALGIPGTPVLSSGAIATTYLLSSVKSCANAALSW